MKVLWLFSENRLTFDEVVKVWKSGVYFLRTSKPRVKRDFHPTQRTQRTQRNERNGCNATNASDATTATILASWPSRQLRFVAYFTCVRCVRCIKWKGNHGLAESVACWRQTMTTTTRRWSESVFANTYFTFFFRFQKNMTFYVFFKWPVKKNVKKSLAKI